MKTVLFFLLVCVTPPMVFAASLPQTIAFEFQEYGKFTGVVGKAYVTEKTIEMVTFAAKNGKAVPFAFIETILEKRSQAEGLYNVKCRNQIGAVSAGTIDVRDPLKPKMTLTTDNGITITNISDGGRKLQKELLPKVDLGR